MDDAPNDDEKDKNEITDSDEIPYDTVYKESNINKVVIENKKYKEENNQNLNNNNNKFDAPKLPEKNKKSIQTI